MWLSFTPAQPEQFGHAIAKRVSVTPAQSAVLPPREWPTTATRFASSEGSVSIQSITRLAPHAQALSAPQLSAVRSIGSWKQSNTSALKPLSSSSATSVTSKATVA